ncbi:TerC family protein [Neobacillus sp. LXY-4]|uniref:TerC family protein n=1 Tax=Neobacillus sp. LXY-4 TaxID=3379826 RepID=UPI003EE3A881
MDYEVIITVLKIIMIDIILSGDNAIVIAMATRSLPKEYQNKAIFWGTGFAVFARIALATIIVLIMNIPYIHAVAGLLLAYIAWGVLNQGEEEANIKSHNSVGKAIATIAVADLTMSLDNVVAVAGVAEGHIGLLILGIAISIPLMIFGSKWLVGMMGKYPIIIYIGAGILAWTAGEMIVGDERLTSLLNISESVGYVIAAVLTVGIVLGGYIRNKKNEKDANEDRATA